MFSWLAVPCISSNLHCRYNITPPCHLFSEKWDTKIQVLVATHNHSFVSRKGAQRGQGSYWFRARLLSYLVIAGGESCLPRHLNQYAFPYQCWNLTSVEEGPVGCTDRWHPCLKKCLEPESRGGVRTEGLPGLGSGFHFLHSKHQAQKRSHASIKPLSLKQEGEINERSPPKQWH